MLELFLLGMLGGMAANKVKKTMMTSKSQQYRKAIADPKNAEYVRYITEVEKARGMPSGLLLRVAFQESAFRPDVISGKTKSIKGAVGMFQIVPSKNAIDISVALDWRRACDLAAGEFLKLKKRFGKWEYALKAYNCGQGNLAKLLAGNDKPGMAGGGECKSRETLSYWSEISADVIGLGG
ncbi:MAG: transglycosylase SLT domain-containing protein [Sulfuricella sp.]|nr:transglycosylase SLT domain-containing protein [Sulfuricella sp.]